MKRVTVTISSYTERATRINYSKSCNWYTKFEVSLENLTRLGSLIRYSYQMANKFQFSRKFKFYNSFIKNRWILRDRKTHQHFEIIWFKCASKYKIIFHARKFGIWLRKLWNSTKLLWSFSAMKAHKPTDATTNPSLILSAAQQEQYQHLIERAVKHGNKTGTWVISISFYEIIFSQFFFTFC